MKTPKIVELPDFENEYLELEELNELKDIGDLDKYHQDYVSYEMDLTEIIRDKR